MKLLHNIKKMLHPQTVLDGMMKNRLFDSELRLVMNSRLNELTQMAIHSQERGISNQKYCKEDIIVSLTTFGGRFYDAYIAIESIMQGSMKPNRIILWVSEDFNGIALPTTLTNQVKRGLEIKYCKDIRSYTKLIYSLKEFPEASIITVDDDIIYPFDTLENLILTHNKYPNKICANVLRPLPPTLNEFTTFNNLGFASHFEAEYDRYILEGYSGVLYPPHSLHKEVFNEDLFLDICKYADDVWFSAMAMLNNTKIISAHPHLYFFDFINNTKIQSVALQNINIKGECLNDAQIRAVFGLYNLR